jgi:ABC-2 type transport system permease protein
MTADLHDTPIVSSSPSESASRPIYWSVQSELWENRSVYLAPLVVAAVVMFGFVISLITLPHRMHVVAALGAAKQRATVSMPFTFVAGFTVLTAFVVGFFYCLDALHSERRDRSILFWKSLPVSDAVVVLSKASIPLVVLPIYICTIIVGAQLMMLLLSTVVLMGSPHSLAIFLTDVKFFQSVVAMMYALIAIALWHAPIYGWLLLVSAWARRATFLWAVLPFFAISILERMAFNTSYFGKFIAYRFAGWFMRAINVSTAGNPPVDPLASLTPGRFLATSGLWIGLLFAAAFIAAAIRLRRNREPI